MRHPTDRSSRLLRLANIANEVRRDVYDKQPGIDAICEAIIPDQPWCIGDPVLRLGPSAGPSPSRGGPVSSETKP